MSQSSLELHVVLLFTFDTRRLLRNPTLPYKILKPRLVLALPCNLHSQSQTCPRAGIDRFCRFKLDFSWN